MIWEVGGLGVGHTTHAEARTGCTVVLVSVPVVASGEVWGSAPATRESALLEPTATVEHVDAVVLSGGSAFGLAAGDGAVQWLEDHDRGFPTKWGRVPIVVGLSLFDLPVGDPSVRPTAADGRAACEQAATSPSTALGRLGAGTGATVSKWRGEGGAVDAGLVGAVARDGDLVVATLVAVNAWGDVVGVGPWDAPEPAIPDPEPGGSAFGGEAGAPAANTTIGVVATNAVLDKVGCMHLARGAHDGLARAVSPPHASVDGDAFVALATGQVAAPVDRVRWMAVKVVDEAIRTLAGPG